MSEQFEMVIAGSRPFALALFAPLTERVGTRPRIAADPAQAAALVPQAGLVVVELLDPAWLAAVKALVAARPALRFVAALPSGAEGAAAPLRSLGVEAIAWTNAAALLPLVDRALGRGQVAPPAAAPPPVPKPPPAVAAPPAVARPPVEGLDDDDFDVDVADALEPDPFAGGVVAQEPADGAAAWTPDATWPANAPDLEVSERALLAAVDGAAPPIPELAGVAAQVAAALSDIERAALLGASPGFDATPIRRAAAMRVRVGFAFASAPPAGSNSDSAAVAAFLGEIDELLSEVNALAVNVPEELVPALGACRNALVKEAIDFSEVAQRYVPVDVEAIPRPDQRKPAAKVAGARVLSQGRVTDAEKRQEKRQRRTWIVFAIAVAIAAAYHGWSFAQSRRQGAPPPTLPGMPPNTVGMELPGSALKVLMVKPGEQLDPEVLRKFKEDEALKGREVVETSPGVFTSMPAVPAPARETKP